MTPLTIGILTTIMMFCLLEIIIIGKKYSPMKRFFCLLEHLAFSVIAGLVVWLIAQIVLILQQLGVQQ